MKMSTCPFCGSDRVTVWSNNDGYWGKCLNCDALGPFVLHGKRKEAVAQWNVRFEALEVEVVEEAEETDDLFGKETV